MQTRRLGTTDLDLSVIGLGTWAIGGAEWDYGWGAQEDKDSREAILEALELGINWIDTAAVYGCGRSESIVGEAIREWGKPVIVATKCGLLCDKMGHVSPRLKRDSIMREVEQSLKRLKADKIDLYQIHWPNPPSDITEAWKALDELKEQGAIRWPAVSNFSRQQLEKINGDYPVPSLQPPYSYLKRDIEKDILPWCREHNAGVIAYSPLQCGVLTDKFSREWVEQLPPNDWRKTKLAYLQEPKLSSVVSLVEKLRSMAAQKGVSVSQLAGAWVLAQSGVTAIIVGARKRGQIAETIKAAGVVLSESDLEQLSKLYSEAKL